MWGSTRPHRHRPLQGLARRPPPKTAREGVSGTKASSEDGRDLRTGYVFVTKGELIFGAFQYLSKLNWLLHYLLPALLPIVIFSSMRKTTQPRTWASRRVRRAAAPPPAS